MITRKFFSLRQFVLIFMILSVLIIPSDLFAREDLTAEDLFDVSFEELIKVYVATKTEMNIQEAPSIVTLITRQQIENMGARNIVDVLRTVPGFDLAHSGNYPIHVTYVRGMSSFMSEKLKIMINGHSIQPFWGEPQLHFDTLPVSSIERIEIIRGPGSALYGTSAFLGVINIITKQGGDNPSQIVFEGGSYDTFRPYAELSYKKNDLKTYLHVQYFQTNGYEGIVESDMASVRPGFAPSDSREMTDSSKHFTFQSNINYKNFYFSSIFQNVEGEVPIGITNVLTDDDDMNTYYAYGELGYKSSIAEDTNIMIKIYHDYAVNDMNYEMFPEETAALQIGFPDDENIHGELFGKWSVTGIEANGNSSLWSTVRIMAGMSCEYFEQFDTKSIANANITGDFLEIDGIEYPPYPYQYFPQGLTDISENGNWLEDANRTVTALYTQGTADLKKIFSLEQGVETLAVTIGARYDHYDDVGSSTNPRFGLTYAPIEKLWFKALYGKAFRAPNFLELYLKNGPLRGNLDLKPEKIETMEFLVGYKFSRIFSAGLTGFYINARDMIRRINTEGSNTYENAGKVESRGVEAEFKATFGKNKYAYLNFTWQNVKDISNAQIVSQGGQVYTQQDFGPGAIPEFYGNVGINYGLTEDIIANISLNYVGKRERSEEKTWLGESLVNMESREPVGDRLLLNASFTFENILARGVNFQVSGFNILDQDHRDPDVRGFIKNDIPRPGATYSGRISYSF